MYSHSHCGVTLYKYYSVSSRILCTVSRILSPTHQIRSTEYLYCTPYGKKVARPGSLDASSLLVFHFGLSALNGFFFSAKELLPSLLSVLLPSQPTHNQHTSHSSPPDSAPLYFHPSPKILLLFSSLPFAFLPSQSVSIEQDRGVLFTRLSASKSVSSAFPHVRDTHTVLLLFPSSNTSSLVFHQATQVLIPHLIFCTSRKVHLPRPHLVKHNQPAGFHPTWLTS
jgi:hypothetical protein